MKSVVYILKVNVLVRNLSGLQCNDIIHKKDFDQSSSIGL